MVSEAGYRRHDGTPNTQMARSFARAIRIVSKSVHPAQLTGSMISRRVGLGAFLAAVLDDLVAHFVAFTERAQACPLDCRDVHEDILAAALGLDEP